MKLPKTKQKKVFIMIKLKENYIEAKNILGEILPVANVCLQMINPAQRKHVMNLLGKSVFPWTCFKCSSEIRSVT